MKTLSEFLAEQIIDRKDFINPRTGNDTEYKEMLKCCTNDLHNGIEAYKKYLKTDCPKTVQWAMIEKQLIAALEKMEAEGHDSGPTLKDEKIIENGPVTKLDAPKDDYDCSSDCVCKS